VPEGEAWEDNLWRKGAFEVTRKDTKAVLYSKKVSVPPHPPPCQHTAGGQPVAKQRCGLTHSALTPHDGAVEFCRRRAHTL
jgi:hypothetical protein